MHRVMIVDDEPTIQQLLRIILEDMGYEVVAQSMNGETALKAYEGMDPKPDVLIIDHRMPVMTGLDLAKCVLEREPGQKILFLTADETIKSRVKEIGVSAFLEKPAEIDVIRQSVRSLIDG